MLSENDIENALNDPRIQEIIEQMFANVMPLIGCCKTETQTRWFSDYRYPPVYRKYIGNVLRCPRLKQRIVDKCQNVLDSGLFDLDWLKISFTQLGVAFEVPGVNGCYINPEHWEYGEHNIDTPNQAYCLFLCLIGALYEIYQAIVVWIKTPDAGLEENEGENYFELKQNISSRTDRFWVTEQDYPNDNLIIVVAKTWQDAEKVARKNDIEERVSPCHDNYKILSPLQVYDVKVFLVETPTPFVHQVLASSHYHAEDIVKEHYKREKLLFTIKSITVEQKSRFIRPGIVTIL